MSTIVVFGGTGYTGGNIVREAAARGHRVISVSRSAPADPVEGARYEAGPVEEVAPRVIPGADTVVYIRRSCQAPQTRRERADS